MRLKKIAAKQPRMKAAASAMRLVWSTRDADRETKMKSAFEAIKLLRAARLRSNEA